MPNLPQALNISNLHQAGNFNLLFAPGKGMIFAPLSMRTLTISVLSVRECHARAEKLALYTMLKMSTLESGISWNGETHYLKCE